ncbi:hypothetical protein EZJ43_10475 [Pedobacter changchengzhani]|uniref:Uncharacterized protein n=1 Tax=Pedobacter changchengzhani TaxID=2529274 RepID=A0A4R5MKY7_9SPHI|nr:hypothetical protein [Pedobacter changchengzhani]TDG36096.1 hypothetical protein EZJ43_10475 [Pedobacter changchengzhani]
MESLKQIKATPKTGAECISNDGDQTNYSLLDFWRWSVSDILSNATRGRFAEFIVGTAVGINPLDLRDEWDAYDITSPSGIKIEVKSAAYIQSWNQKAFSKISFSIKKARFWDAINNMRNGAPQRHADVYVLCHLKHQDQNTIDPLKMEQWDFYVLPTIRLDNYTRSQHSITLNSLKKLVEPVAYKDLKMEIEKAYGQQKTPI